MSDGIRRSITQDTIDRYGRINGDNDIIHYDADYAARRGFRGTLAHGLMVMGYAAEFGVLRHGADWFRGGELSVTWTAPVCPGDDVVITTQDDGTVTATADNETALVGSLGVQTGRH